MTEIMLVLTEDALTQADAEHIATLHTGESLRCHVLVPTDPHRNVLASLVDHLSLGELREAFDDVRGRGADQGSGRRAAEEAVVESVERLREAGIDADGDVTTDAPMDALSAAMGRGDVREVVVVTLPHAVEDTLHTDWASQARERLEVPVLHLYSGTNRIG